MSLEIGGTIRVREPESIGLSRACSQGKSHAHVSEKIIALERRIKR